MPTDGLLVDDLAPADEGSLPESPQIEATSIDAVATATAALDRAEAPDAPELNVPLPEPTPVAVPSETERRTGTGIFAVTKPFIQVGTFTVKATADEAAAKLRSGGVLPVIKEQSGQNSTFYRVLVGPATNRGERRALHKTVKDLGFGDSYFVSS